MGATKFFGVMLIVVGVLMVVFCGGCTLISVIASVLSGLSQPSAAAAGGIVTALIVVGIVGGLPTAAGAVLVWGGLKVVRTPPPEPQVKPETFE